MAVVAPVLTVTVAVAVLTGLLVCRRRVHQRFPPESHQPGRSSAPLPPFFTDVLCADMHPHCPSADTVSQSPCDYESIDFQPTGSELVPSFTAFNHGCSLNFINYMFCFVFFNLTVNEIQDGSVTNACSQDIIYVLCQEENGCESFVLIIII